MKRNQALIIASYLAIYIIWGSTYFFIRMSVMTIPPSWVLVLRWTAGAVLFLGIWLFRGNITKPSLKEVLSSLFLGFFLLFAGNGLVTIAEKTVDSYIAALLVASTPFMVAFLNRLLFRLPVPLIKIAGIGIGIVGVGFLLYAGGSIASMFSPSILIAFAGISFWAFGTSMAHRLPVHPDIFFRSGLQMLFVAVLSLGAVFISGDRLPVPDAQGVAASLIAVAYLGVFGSLAMVAYNYLLEHESSFRITSYALVNPVIATLLGLLAGGEKAAPFLIVGLPLILAGLVFMLYGEAIVARIGAKKTGSGGSGVA